MKLPANILIIQFDFFVRQPCSCARTPLLWQNPFSIESKLGDITWENLEQLVTEPKESKWQNPKLGVFSEADYAGTGLWKYMKSGGKVRNCED